jgi:hypothetical protein
MSQKFNYSEELRRDATRLAIFTDEYDVEEFRTALLHDNKPVYFFEDGQYVLAMPANLGGYVIQINGNVILHKREIEDIENVFLDLIVNMSRMIKLGVDNLRMPIE